MVDVVVGTFLISHQMIVILMCGDLYIGMCMHACVRACVRTCVRACLCVCECVCVCACMHACA